jgi:hypothetical protein
MSTRGEQGFAAWQQCPTIRPRLPTSENIRTSCVDAHYGRQPKIPATATHKVPNSVPPLRRALDPLDKRGGGFPGNVPVVDLANAAICPGQKGILPTAVRKNAGQ